MKIFEFIPVSSFLIIVILLVGKTLSLKKNGIKLSSGAGKTRKFSLAVMLVFSIVLLLWLFEISKCTFHWSFSLIPALFTDYLFTSFILKTIGSIMIILALTLFTLTLLHFKSSLRFGLDENNQGKLITSGVFAISRNPFFLSLDLYFLGVAFVLPNLFLIGFAILSIISIHFFILKEEKFMLKVYGNEYEKYKQQAKRYISFKTSYLSN